MIKFDITASDVRMLQAQEGCSLSEALKRLEKDRLKKELYKAVVNNDPVALGDVVEHIIERAL